MFSKNACFNVFLHTDFLNFYTKFLCKIDHFIKFRFIFCISFRNKNPIVLNEFIYTNCKDFIEYHDVWSEFKTCRPKNRTWMNFFVLIFWPFFTVRKSYIFHYHNIFFLAVVFGNRYKCKSKIIAILMFYDYTSINYHSRHWPTHFKYMYVGLYSLKQF